MSEPMYRVCETCKKSFELNPRYGLNYSIKTNRGRFCSRKCYYDWRKGMRVSPNTEFKSENMRWDKHPLFTTGIWSYQQFREDKCFHCKGIKNLLVHHIDRNRNNNKISNLRTVCAKCHHTIEHKHIFYGNQYV
jgi:hypothetical protein